MASLAAVPAPPRSRVLDANLAIVLANIMIGLGNIVSQVTLHGVNPAFFALIREVIAGPLLLSASCLTGGGYIRKEDRWRFILMGICYFNMSFLYMVGVKICGATSAAMWQPIQPVMITCMAVALKYERATWSKVSGIVVATTGILFYSLYDNVNGNTSSEDLGSKIVGNLLFFVQCLSISTYFVFQKPLIQKKYSAITILGWSNIMASVLTVIVVGVINSQRALIDLVCPDCNGDGWHLSDNALLGVAYWVFAVSIASCFLLTWGNQYADASLVGIYTVVQPMVTTIGSIAIIACTAAPHFGLTGLTPACAGAVGIIIGLSLVVHDNWRNGQKHLPMGAVLNNIDVADNEKATRSDEADNQRATRPRFFSSSHSAE